jgi:hypothetical protein
MNTSLNEIKVSKNNNPTGTMRCAAYVRTGTIHEVDDCMTAVAQRCRPEKPARTFLQFQRDQDDRHMARSELLGHTVDLWGRGAQ